MLDDSAAEEFRSFSELPLGRVLLEDTDRHGGHRARRLLRRQVQVELHLVQALAVT